MSNSLDLLPGKKYKVVKAFTDYDRQIHPPGEKWTFMYTNFLPYEDGLTLHVQLAEVPGETVYRLQWRAEEQAYIIDHFSDYVAVC